MLSSSRHKHRIKTSFLYLLGCFIFLGIPIHLPDTLQAKQREPFMNSRRFNNAETPALENGYDLQLQLVNLAAEVNETLAVMEESLIHGLHIRKERIALVKLRIQLASLNKKIYQYYMKVQQHCEENHLPYIAFQRVNNSLDNYNTTRNTIIQAMNIVLNRNKQYDFPLIARIRKSREILDGIQIKVEPDLDKSKPATLEKRRLQDVQPIAFDPNISTVNVTIAAAVEPPVMSDLLETMGVQITDEIIAEANKLGHSPLVIYEYVRNQFEFQPYYGSRKGSTETLRQRCGNDYDLASLTIALLRASGIEARYATGTVQMPVEHVTSWLGVDDPYVAWSILSTLGFEGTRINDDGTLVALRCPKVWVEAYVSRGRAGKAWVPLDPSFKLHEIDPGMDIPALMSFDAQGFIDEYVTPTDPAVVLPREETVLELFRQEIADYLALNDPNETVESVKRTQEIIPEDLGLLPASLPYKVISRDASFSEIPADKVYQIRIHLYQGGTLIDRTYELPEIAGERITISWEGATPSDVSIIESYGALLGTPPNLVDIKPVLKIGGQIEAVGAFSVGAGTKATCDIHFMPAVNGSMPQNPIPLVQNEMICGDYKTICLAVHGTSNPLFRPTDANDTEDFIAKLRYATGIGYLQKCIDTENELGALFGVKVVNDVDCAIIQDQIPVTLLGGNPDSWEWKGLRIDADRKFTGNWRVDSLEPPCGPEDKAVNLLAGTDSSVFEHKTFENDMYHESVSTLKVLQLAFDQGIPIYERWNSTTLPAGITLPVEIQNAIISAIASGNVVTFPAHEITHYNWTGTGYIDVNPCNGAAAYILTDDLSGGSTVDTWEDPIFWWGPAKEWIEGDIETPKADSPNEPEALFPKTCRDNLVFLYKLRVKFKNQDNYTDWIWYRHEYHPPYLMQPDHYTLKVGDKSPPSVDANPQGSSNENERKITIYDVEIRGEGDSDPPQYIPVEPNDPQMLPISESFEAKVIPDGLAGDFLWNNGSGNLNIIFPANKTTKIESNSFTPSNRIRAENITVDFVPDSCQGDSDKIQTSLEHYMTIYGLEITDGDETSPPSEYIAVNHFEQLKGTVKPDGVKGYMSWSKNSDKVSLYSLSGKLGKEWVNINAKDQPSNQLYDVEVTPHFKPEGQENTHDFPPEMMTVVKVEFTEDPNQKYGFDNYTEDVPWKSLSSSDPQGDTVYVLVDPPGVISRGGIYFIDPNSSITITDQPLTNSLGKLTLLASTSGESEIQANVNKQDGKTAGRLKVATYDPNQLTIASIIVHAPGITVKPIPSNSDIQKYLNDIFRQAVLSVQVQYPPQPVFTLNYDLNGDGYLDVYQPGWGRWTDEMKVVRDNAGNVNYDRNLFFMSRGITDGGEVPGPNYGFCPDYKGRYIFVFVNHHYPHIPGLIEYTIAHEFGHTLLGLDHYSGEKTKENLMWGTISPSARKLSKNQWDKIHSP